jgi:glyoxylate reductase
MKKNLKVFVTRDIPDIGINLLRKNGFDVTVWQKDEPIRQPVLIEETKKVNALLCTSPDKLDAEFLKECAHLDIISQYAAGYDNIDLNEATRLGIPVGNTPDAMSEATADIAFGLMIAVSRKMFYMYRKIEKGEWGVFRPRANLGIELKNKTLGIFGLGRIGFQMALRCKGAYDMKIIYHNRKPNAEAEKKLGAKWVSFEDLLQQSDVISVHAALNETTREIFNAAAFSKMKKNSIFINTSRGALHNEKDLTAALKNGEIWGAGLDVTNPEPMRHDNPLLFLDNTAILPHIGSATIEARDEMSRLAAQNIIEFYSTGQVPHLVNPEVMGKIGNRQ